MTFAGVIVTYNRKKDLEKNLIAEKMQTKKFDRVYIIDNCSTDNTYEYLDDGGYLSEDVIYVRLKKNTGGAGGFYAGVNKAYKDGYDLICLMDDDGRPIDEVSFERLYCAAVRIHSTNKKLMLNSLVLRDAEAGELCFGLNGCNYSKEIERHAVDAIYEGFINPFNGTVISRELVEAIGYPNKDFFVYGDEVDYQNRAIKDGAFIGSVTNSRYYHPSAGKVSFRWRGGKAFFIIHPPWKEYYAVRNSVFLRKRDVGIMSAIKAFVFRLYATIKCNPEYRSCFRMLFKGFVDGMAGKLGKRVEPGTK